MKNLNELYRNLLGKTFIGLSFLFAIGCNDPVQKDLTVADPGFQGIEQWQDLLEGLPFGKSVIVQQGASIQDAIHAAVPGDIIYIEPGTYREAVTIDRAGIKLIGLDGANGGQVILENPGGAENGINVGKLATGIDIRNIEFRNFADNTLPVFDKPSTPGARHGRYFKMSREWIYGNIAYYEFEIRIGNRPFDVIRLRRFVRERRPYHPIRTQGEVFMVHGAAQDFEIFYRSGVEHPTPDQSVAVYLASKGIDVWGIDQAWTLVPEETTDFGFMKEWGVERDTDNTLAALAIARLVRGLTGQGFGRMNLLGFSYGVAVAYSAAGRETQQHPILRDIKGLVQVDQILKYPEADETYRLNTCALTANILNQLNAGIYVNNGGQFVAGVGNLAFSMPSGDSPFFPGLTNAQAAIFLGANRYLLGNTPPAPFWHFTGGNQPSPNVPATDLLFTDAGRWLRPVPGVPSPFYMPLLAGYELNACMCDETDVSFDDHFAQISLPVFYLGAEGSFGSLGIHTATLTNSPEITTHVVSETSERYNDFGHADLFMAKDADKLAWEPLRQWLVAHD